MKLTDSENFSSEKSSDYHRCPQTEREECCDLEDHAIVALYWAREERALEETDRKYGSYCRTISNNILRNREDAEECVNDTYMRAWNAMPPQRPAILSSFLGKIARNLSLDRYKARHAEKRGGGSLPLALDELGECIPGQNGVEQALAEAELARSIDRFRQWTAQKRLPAALL